MFISSVENREGEQIKAVVSAVILIDENVLLVKRASDSYQGDKWALPGGKVEKGELLDNAIQREIYEELGINFIQFNQSGSFVRFDRGITWNIYIYMANIDIATFNSIILDTKENSEVGLFKLEDLDSLQIAFGHEEIIKSLLQDKISN